MLRIPYIFLIIIPFSIFCAFYEDSSDNSDCYYDDDSNDTTTTVSDITTVVYTIPATTQLSYSVCPSGWTMFNRSAGHWCMYFYVNRTTSFDQAGAELACEDLFDAVLTGFQNTAEVTTMLAISNAEFSATGTLYIGAIRSSSCYVANVSCTQATTFNWTDGFTTGTDGFSSTAWGAGEPATLTDGCAVLSNAVQGLADEPCTSPLAAAVCGKLATTVYY